MKDLSTKTQELRSIIEECSANYRASGLDIFTATERIEELWFEIFDLLDEMERAEALREDETLHDRMMSVYHKLGRVQRELPEQYR